MTTEYERLSYALAKQVPDMERGFCIETSYGEIEIDADDAEVIAEAVRKVLRRRLQSLGASNADWSVTAAPLSCPRMARRLGGRAFASRPLSWVVAGVITGM